jgi:VWFA-related protein
MRCSLPFGATICLSAGLAVGAGGGGSEALADQELSNIFRDTEEVHVINVDVVVTDAEGRPVTGLTAEDFRLFEDGRPVEISNFYPVDEGRPVPLPAEATGGLGGRDVGGRREGTPAAPAEPAPPPELHLVVYIDNVHLSPIHRNRVLTRLDELLSRSWRPGMSVMLVSNERALEIRQPFTDRREDVLAALDGLKSTGSRGSRLDQDREALLAAMGQVSVDIGSGLFDTKAGLSGGARSVGPGTEGEEEGPQQQGPGVVSQSDLTAKVAAEAYALVPQLLAYAQARNDEVAASLDVLERLVDLLSGLPGRKAVLHVSDGLSANPAEAIFEAFDRLFEVLPRSPNLVGLSKEAVRFDLLADFRDLAAAANAGRVSLYTLDASPPEAVSRAGAENANEIRNLGFSSTEERNAQESLVLLAEETGGRSSLSNVTLDSTVTGLFADFGSYYSLGYAAEREPGRERHIEVRLADRRRGVTVRYRRTMRDREPQELMAERTLAALVLGTAENPLQVKLEALDPQPAEDGNFLVPVRVRIPLAKLVLIPGAREHEARVSMYVAAVDDRGRASEVIRQVCPIRIPNAELLVALGGHAECGVRLLVRPGEQRVAVSVRDEMSARDSTVQLDLEVPEAPAVGRGPDGESEPDEVGSRGGDSRSAEAPRASR